MTLKSCIVILSESPYHTINFMYINTTLLISCSLTSILNSFRHDKYLTRQNNTRFLSYDVFIVILSAPIFVFALNGNQINSLKTKRRPLYLKTQSVPRSKPFRLGYKNLSVCVVWGRSHCLFSDKYKTHKYSVGRA